MNVRAILHALEGVAAAIAMGTVGFAGLSQTATTDVVAGAGLVVIFISTYLGSTSSGTTSTALAAERADRSNPVP